MALEPVGGGGGGGAAGTYEVLDQRPDILIQSATQVVDAMTITVSEKLYGVIFSFTIPRREWAADGTQYWASLYASWVQAMGADERVVGMSYTQLLTASNALKDAMEITVGLPNRSDTADVTWPIATLNSEAAFGAVQTAYNQLAAVAQSG